jgi:hypothetical protein
MSWASGDPAPALVAHPPAAANLDEAHGAIEQWEHYSGKRLDAAQRLAVEHMMAVRADGMWAARTTGRSVSRQNGKGDEIEVVEAWDLTQRAAPVVHSAHEIPTAKKAHLRLVAHLHSHRDLRRLVKQVRYANGDQSIEMVNEGIIVYRTRTAGGGRGLDDIGRLVVDEAQWVQAEQLASSTPILAVNPNPQTNFMGSAGIEARSAHWWGHRKRALAGGGGSFAWLEHSAEQVTMTVGGEVVSIPPNPADVDAWAVANPAFPARISAEFLAEQLKVLGPDLFAREHLGVWDPMPGDLPSVFGAGKWEACAGPQPAGLRVAALAVAAEFELKHSAVAAATTSGADVYVKPLQHGPGVRWLVPRVQQLQREHGVDVVVDPKGPAAELIPILEAEAITVRQPSTPEVLDACAGIFDLVQDRLLHHERFPELDRAVAAAVKRPVGDRWAWGRRQEADISTLEAVTLAAWWAVASQRFMPAIY